VLTHIIMAVLGAALAVGLLLSFYSPSGSSLPGSGEVPSPGTSAAPLTGGLRFGLAEAEGSVSDRRQARAPARRKRN
jgi:hypothetical protein